MASYTLKGSYSTVQVLSPTLTNEVVYCTIQTSPSNVVASVAVDKAFFDAGVGNEQLGYFADGIEAIMGINGVVAGQGTQLVDENGLLSDNVTFTVTYTPPGANQGAVTAEAVVPAGYLDAAPGTTSGGGITAAEAIINEAIFNLQTLAGG